MATLGRGFAPLIRRNCTRLRIAPALMGLRVAQIYTRWERLRESLRYMT